MKLAEALLLRAEYQQRLGNLQKRILNSLKIQEGEEPNENPQELLTEFSQLNQDLSQLIKEINRVNNITQLADGRTLSEGLVDREGLLKKRALLTKITDAGSEQDYRLTRTEIKMVLTMQMSKVQKEIDQLSKAFRQLDTQIQSLNWTTEL